MITNFPIVLGNGQVLPPAELQGKVILVVNVASKCGFTPQYAELQELSKCSQCREEALAG